jgi:hypothetical protein
VKEHHSELMGKAIIRGVLIGVPTMLVLLTITVYLITDIGWRESAATAVLPGILLGAFGGGFAGMSMTMEE